MELTKLKLVVTDAIKAEEKCTRQLEIEGTGVLLAENEVLHFQGIARECRDAYSEASRDLEAAKEARREAEVALAAKQQSP